MTRIGFAACVLAAVAVGVVTGSEKGWSVVQTAAVSFGWIRDLDAPARNPYQQGQFVTDCPGSVECTLTFPGAPAGKTLIVTHASCQVVMVSGGSLGGAFLASATSPPAEDSLVYYTQNAAGTAYSINTMTNFYFKPGEQPVIILLTENQPINSGDCTLTGYLYP